MMLAIRLHQAGEYDAALDWFRLALDWTLGNEQAVQQSRFLSRHSKVAALWNVTDDWLRDPLHPHAIAATRPRAYARFTFFSIIRCYLDYADSEFTAENTAKAKRLYQQALDLLDADVFRIVDPCAPKQSPPQLDPNVVGQIGDKFKPELPDFFREITPFEEAVRNRFIKKLQDLVENGKLGSGLPKLWQEIEATRDRLPPPPTLAEVLTANDKFVSKLAAAIPSNPDFGLQVDLAIDAALIRYNAILGREPDRNGDGPDGQRPRTARARANFGANADFVLGVAIDESAPDISDIYGVGAGYGLLTGALNPFCVPVNPLMRALRLHAEVNIHKIQNCRNIAGMKRALDLYGAPTDTATGMPTIGAGGQLTMPGILRMAPTQYRFRFLIERARQLVQFAQQTESAMFSVLGQRDTAGYSLFSAKQDVLLGRSEVTLQDLRLKETNDELTLANIQKDRVSYQLAYFSNLLRADLNAHEIANLILTGIAYTHAVLAASGYFGTSWLMPQNWIQGVQAAGQGWSLKASIAATLAQYERRREEWRYQRTLSQFDLSASNQQVTIAADRVQIVTQERAIAKLKTQIAEDTVEYLTNQQFVTVELLDWMADILEGVYRSVLQQATAVARLASSQLAFERQEAPPAFIQADYWTVRESLTNGLGEQPDRKGLTGSTRLLNDIELLNQHALDTDRRKLNITKTISLAQLAPLEFEQFRNSGVFTVATPMSLFDQDFPGQYLRLVKRVRLSLFALIPPTAGIKATLTASAASRVVVGGDLFQTIRVQHGPESLALTSTQNATGVFDFDIQPEMLAPFEGIGVDTVWEFKLPKAANPFNYNTIADVLLTLDYSALFSYDYQQIVLAQMRPTLEAERGFSFRHEFADAWYDLLNPGQSSTPMTVRFKTTYADFPANLDRLAIRNVAFAFLRKNGTSFEIPIAGLHFTPDGDATNYGGAANTTEGIASTRRGNAQSWTSLTGHTPCGIWELALPNSTAVRNRFSSGEIENAILVVSYSGRRPNWV
jgi:tetratricopeptide (TPR) repeat protein